MYWTKIKTYGGVNCLPGLYNKHYSNNGGNVSFEETHNQLKCF